MDDASRTCLVRLSGTISTKSSKVRHRFTERLVDNIRAALARHEIDFELRREWNRIFVDTDDPDVAEILSRVPGVQSLRPARRVGWETLDDIVALGTQMFSDRVRNRTFGVQARRVGQRDRFDFESPEVNRRLGTALDEAGGDVDLDDPDVPVSLEIHYDDVYFYESDVPGPAGLPIGTQGSALALVSGGFDSAVAVWEMLKRGVSVDLCFFNLGGPPHERGVRQVMGRLVERCGYGWDPTIHVVDFRPILAELKVNVPGNYWQLVLKRVMMRAGSALADELDLPAMVTGESVGQVSTQTLHNLAALEKPGDTPLVTPIFRPLLSFNKEDILERARRLGVYDVAKTTPEFCALEGGKPVIKSSARKLDEREAAMDLSLVDTVVADRRVENMRQLAARPDRGDVRIDHVPDGAALLDLRSEQQFESWHPPDAVHVPFETAMEQYAALPKQPTWVLYCDVGLKSSLIAEKMQKVGFDAHSFAGGVPRLRTWLENHERQSA